MTLISRIHPGVSRFIIKPDPCVYSDMLQYQPDLQSGLTIAICTYKRANSLMRLLDSIQSQELKADEILVVDASPDHQTLELIESYDTGSTIIKYFQVGDRHKGLTKQRNFALDIAGYDNVAFFDDDVVLLPHCLEHMYAALSQKHVVGVAGNPKQKISKFGRHKWTMRLIFRIVPDLQPGKYHRSGMSIPWIFLHARTGTYKGDVLPGCCTMWNTDVARNVRYNESFAGYAQSEDAEFSLRASNYGDLLMVADAKILHFQDPAGRPNQVSLGYMAIYNRYKVHQLLKNRTKRDIAYFWYAWTMDTLMLLQLVVRPKMTTIGLKQIWGRTKGTWDILINRKSY